MENKTSTPAEDALAVLTEKTVYQCGHSVSTEVVTCCGHDQERVSNISLICYACQQALIGTRQDVIRYGKIPANGNSYNYRDNRYEAGISCYLPTMRPRAEFTEGRKKIKMSAIIIGWGGDDEPLIDAKTII